MNFYQATAQCRGCLSSTFVLVGQAGQLRCAVQQHGQGDRFCLVWLSIEPTFGYWPAQMTHPRILVKKSMQIFTLRITGVAKSSKIAIDFTSRNYALQAGFKSILFPLKLAVETGIHLFGTSFENRRLGKSTEVVFVLI